MKIVYKYRIPNMKVLSAVMGFRLKLSLLSHITVKSDVIRQYLLYCNGKCLTRSTHSTYASCDLRCQVFK